MTLILDEISTEWLLTYLNFLLNDFKPSWTPFWMTFILAELSTGWLFILPESSTS